MASNRIELLQRGYQAWNDRDVLELCDPAIELEPLIGGVLVAGPFQGHSGVRRLCKLAARAWSESRLDPEDFVETGECVVVFVHVRLRAPSGGFELVGDVAHVCRIPDRLVTRFEGYRDRDDALRLAGVG